MCASAARRTARLPPITTSAVVAAVPTLCPTIIAQPCSNVSEPAFSATSVVAAAAVELCMTIVMTIPMPARIHTSRGRAPQMPSRFHETPSIPVCRYSIPMKISPKPARIAPSDRVLPLAISQRKAPTPRIGRAAAEMLTRKPKIATIHGVEVVPSVAPMMTPIACEKVTSPALTKPMTVRVAAVED